MAHETNKKGLKLADLKISRQTVTTHLRELIKERKVYKKNQRYFNNDPILGNILSFARHMNQASNILIPSIIDQAYDEESEHTPWYYGRSSAAKNLGKRVRGGIVSDRYYRTDSSEGESSEKRLFEVANRIGGFIVYIFIEAIRQYCGSYTTKLDTDRKEELATRLIQRAIDIPKIYEHFQNGFYISTSTKRRQVKHNANVLRKLTTSFQKVYPEIYEGLEQWWSDSIGIGVVVENALSKEITHMDHKHHWERFKIYKLESLARFRCRECGQYK